jgi:hypothetical protein
MPQDVADVALDRVKRFTIGFGQAGDASRGAAF